MFRCIFAVVCHLGLLFIHNRLLVANGQRMIRDIGCQRHRICLPFKPFVRENVWLPKSDRAATSAQIGVEKSSFYPSELQGRSSQQLGLHQFTETGSCDLIDSVPQLRDGTFPTLPAQRVPRLEQSVCNTCSWCSRWRDAVSPESFPRGFRERTDCCLSYCWLLGTMSQYGASLQTPRWIGSRICSTADWPHACDQTDAKS